MRRVPPRPSAAPGAGLILVYAALLAWAMHAGRLPWAVPATVVGLSVLTFVLYGVDKRAARTAQWRTPESRLLLLLGLAGGWAGAWCAQRLFRHKSSKASFMARYWATVGLHLAAMLAWLFWPGARSLLR